MSNSFLQILQIWPKLHTLSMMGSVVGVLLLVSALLISIYLLRSLRVSAWIAICTYGSLVFLAFISGKEPKSSLWLFVIVGIFLLLWTALTPLFLAWQEELMSLFAWLISLNLILDLTHLSIHALGGYLSKKPDSFVEMLILLALVVLMIIKRLPQLAWFRVLLFAYIGGSFAFYGYGILLSKSYLHFNETNNLLLLFSFIAGVLGLAFFLRHFGGKEDLLQRYEPYAGVMATHIFLICFTIATIYPVLWVVKMAVTPRQGFSMGLSPVPTSLSRYVTAWRKGDTEVASCYKRAMAQNFREIMGLGGVCADQICEEYRQSKNHTILNYRKICKPFVVAWKTPPKKRQKALALWQSQMLTAENIASKRLKLQRIIKKIIYKQAEREKQGSLFWQQLFNSLFVAFTTTLLGVFLAGTAGYAFSRFDFPGRQAGLMSFLISQMFPGTLMMIPLYILVSKLGLLNQLMGLTLVYSTISIPFCVWMLKGYFDTIPKELEEAAMIDGASRTLIFWKIMLPLARPAIAVTALFSFMTAWNEFILAATFMNEESSYTLPVMLQRFVGAHNTEWGHFAAGAIIVSLPIIFLFFLLQKHLVGGLTAGSVKG